MPCGAGRGREGGALSGAATGREEQQREIVRKLILMSILIVSVAVPMIAARDRVASRGLRRTVVGFTAFVAVYVFLILYILPRL